MIERRKATQSDFDYVQANPYQEAIKNCPPMVLPEDSDTVDSYTLIEGDKIFAVGGLFLFWEGVAEFWINLSADFKDYISGIRLLRMIKRWVDDAIKQYSLKRAQVLVRKNFAAGIAMVEFLGFRNETPDGMECYFSDGSSAYRFSKITRSL